MYIKTTINLIIKLSPKDFLEILSTLISKGKYDPYSLKLSSKD